MKILFAADMSFNYIPPTSRENAMEAMREPSALFASADFSILNLENIFGTPEDGAPIPKSGPNLISDDSFAEYIHALKPSVIGLANNHSGDFGEVPMMNTIRMLRDSGYTVIGAGKNREDAYAPAILEKDGIRAAIIAVCENEFGCATETKAGSAGYSLGCVTRAIRRVRENGCRPIVYFHGGNEYDPFPSPGKTELYRHFIDLGAEAVIAMHTHCPQGYEMYEGKPIVYSMGNFFFPSEKLGRYASWKVGYLSELNLTADKISLQVHPYRFDQNGIYRMHGEDLAHFTKYLEILCAPIPDDAEIQSWFDSWCLTQSYIPRLSTYEKEMFADGKTEEIKHLKNIFGCEAHNELIRNSMYMIYESRVEAARTRVTMIEKLQRMELL